MASAPAFTPLEPHLDELVQRTFPGRRQLRCEGFVVTEGYREIAEDILSMEVREDDVWVCTYPKSGTTWAEELVWCISNDLDFRGAEVPQILRFPFLEFTQFFRGEKEKFFPDKDNLELPLRLLTHSVDVVKEMKSPRFIKTHLPFNLLPLQLQRGIVKPKIIHVHRNPMDVCISYFHHNQLMMGYKGRLEDFATIFINDADILTLTLISDEKMFMLTYVRSYYVLVLGTPFWRHYLGYLEKKKDFDILYLKFEDMKKNYFKLILTIYEAFLDRSLPCNPRLRKLSDLPSIVKSTVAFLNKTLTDEQVQQLCDHLSFSNMKNNPSANNEDMVSMTKKLNSVESEGRFLREGTVGQWKSKFSAEWVRRFLKWTVDSVHGTELENNIDIND